jgi:ATP-dependent Lon protease
MARPNRIPLFPLDVVLLPGMHFPLHIFEPRYKVMVERCLQEQLEFGMILALDKAVATFGCTAEILSKVKDYPDGRMDIVTEGRAVFRLTELLDEKEYYEGTVEYVTDIPSPADAEKEERHVALFERCHELLFRRPWVVAVRNEPATLAYHLASFLPMELEKKQALLESRSESERQELVLAWLNLFLPKLAERQRARKRAAGNGHALN